MLQMQFVVRLAPPVTEWHGHSSSLICQFVDLHGRDQSIHNLSRKPLMYENHKRMWNQDIHVLIKSSASKSKVFSVYTTQHHIIVLKKCIWNFKRSLEFNYKFQRHLLTSTELYMCLIWIKSILCIKMMKWWKNIRTVSSILIAFKDW